MVEGEEAFGRSVFERKASGSMSEGLKPRLIWGLLLPGLKSRPISGGNFSARPVSEADLFAALCHGYRLRFLGVLRAIGWGRDACEMLNRIVGPISFAA